MSPAGIIGVIFIVGCLALAGWAMYLEHTGYCISPHTCTAGYPPEKK